MASHEFRPWGFGVWTLGLECFHGVGEEGFPETPISLN